MRIIYFINCFQNGRLLLLGFLEKKIYHLKIVFSDTEKSSGRKPISVTSRAVLTPQSHLPLLIKLINGLDSSMCKRKMEKSNKIIHSCTKTIDSFH